MQLVIPRNFSFCFSLALSLTLIAPSAQALGPTANKIVGLSVVTTALTCFLRLVTKKTQPKRVQPASDSIADVSWFVFDELMVGQIEKGDRPSKRRLEEDSNEFLIEYSKIEPRGVTGITYSTLKPVIIPALTFMVLFNKNFKDNAINGCKDVKDFINDPITPVKEIASAFKSIFV